MKKINYNGFNFEYNRFESFKIMNNAYEVELFNDDELVATILLNDKQLNSL